MSALVTSTVGEAVGAAFVTFSVGAAVGIAGTVAANVGAAVAFFVTSTVGAREGMTVVNSAVGAIVDCNVVAIVGSLVLAAFVVAIVGSVVLADVVGSCVVVPSLAFTVGFAVGTGDSVPADTASGILVGMAVFSSVAVVGSVLVVEVVAFTVGRNEGTFVCSAVLSCSLDPIEGLAVESSTGALVGSCTGASVDVFFSSVTVGIVGSRVGEGGCSSAALLRSRAHSTSRILRFIIFYAAVQMIAATSWSQWQTS